MLSRLWKGAPNQQRRCGAEMKIGIQVHHGVRCTLPDGHTGQHQANALTRWGAKEEKHGLQGPGGTDDL